MNVNWGWILGGVSAGVVILTHLVTVTWFLARLSSRTDNLAEKLASVVTELNRDVNELKDTLRGVADDLASRFEKSMKEHRDAGLLLARLQERVAVLERGRHGGGQDT